MKKSHMTFPENDPFIRYAMDVEARMYRPDFWLDNYADADQIRLTDDEICSLNRSILKIGHPAAEDIWSDQWKTSNISYGICVRRTALRRSPSEKIVPDEHQDPYFDQNQLTAVRINTPLLITEQTSDGHWAYVILYDYRGWIKTDDIAVCRSREEWTEAQNMEQFLVVTAPKFTVDITGELLTMGSRLKLLTTGETADYPDYCVPWGCYRVLIPVRKDDGSYGTQIAAVPADSRVHRGFLPCTLRNQFELMFQFLGACYGWGGMYDSVDCSGLIQEVFACFGLMLPRDVDEQMRIPAQTNVFPLSMPANKRKAALTCLQPGSFLAFPGHIATYLGYHNGNYYTLSATGSMMANNTEKSCDGIRRVRRVIINTLNEKNRSGISWLMAMTSALELKKLTII